MDLDDLFRECYFGDFPVGSIADPTIPQTGSTTLPPMESPVTTPLPRMSTTATGTATPTVPTATPSSTTTTTTTQPTAKRTAAQAGMDVAKAVPSGAAAASSRQLTDAQKVERRERNREHAKRSRLRKKFLLESLQEQIHGLQSEIETLKDVIKKELPTKADAILSKLTVNKEKFTPLPMPSGFGPVKTLMEPDFRLMSALSGSQQNFAISDPSLPDNPIVYVSQGFLDLTGYTLDQVLGRNCRFLQGPGTDQNAVEVIRRGIQEGVDTSVCLLNYRADGTPFWNQFFVAALRDAENNVVNFVGVQCEVSKAVVEKQMNEKKQGAATK